MSAVREKCRLSRFDRVREKWTNELHSNNAWKCVDRLIKAGVFDAFFDALVARARIEQGMGRPKRFNCVTLGYENAARNSHPLSVSPYDSA